MASRRLRPSGGGRAKGAGGGDDFLLLHFFQRLRHLSLRPSVRSQVPPPLPAGAGPDGTSAAIGRQRRRLLLSVHPGTLGAGPRPELHGDRGRSGGRRGGGADGGGQVWAAAAADGVAVLGRCLHFHARVLLLPQGGGGGDEGGCPQSSSTYCEAKKLLHFHQTLFVFLLLFV